MSITDELREYADRLSDEAARKSEHGFSPVAMKLEGIADHIDAEHERAMADADATGERQRDAVEVVRCRDCKHMCERDLSAYYGNHEHDQCSCCRLLDPGAISVEPDGFCAWGERRED